MNVGKGQQLARVAVSPFWVEDKRHVTTDEGFLPGFSSNTSLVGVFSLHDTTGKYYDSIN